MSCGCDSGYGYDGGYGVCAPDIPYSNVSHESVPSLIDNLVAALYGTFFDPTTQTGYITKSLQNGKIVWNIPCDPSNTATIAGVERNQGEGLMCYLLRVFQQYNPSSYITTTSTQTLSNKTLTNSIFSGGSITGATLSGCTYSDTVPRSSVSNYLLGSVVGSVPYQSGTNVTTLLSPGTAGQVLTSAGAGQAPYWAAATSVNTSAQNLAGGGAYTLVYQQSGGNTQYLTAGTSGYYLQCNGNSAAPSWVPAPTVTTATNLSGTTVGSVPYQSASATTGYTAAGTTGQVLTSNGTSAPTWVSQSALLAGKATNLNNGSAGNIPYQTGSGATSFVTNGTSGQYLQSNGSSAPSWVTPSFAVAGRNRIVNGNMDIDQRRNCSTSVTINSYPSQSNFISDRFRCLLNGSSLVLSGQTFSSLNTLSVAPPTGSYSYAGVTTATAEVAYDQYTSAYIQHSIDTSRVVDILLAPTMPQTVLSFYVYSSVAGNFSGTVLTQIGTSRIFPFDYTINTANTWQKISIQIPSDGSYSRPTILPPDGKDCLIIRFDLGSGSYYAGGTANTWASYTFGTFTRSSSSNLTTNLLTTAGAIFYITQVQFEIGSSASSFELLPTAQVLNTCRNFYENNYYLGFGNAVNAPVGSTLSTPPIYGVPSTTPELFMVWVTGLSSATNYSIWVPFKQTKLPPSGSQYSTQTISPTSGIGGKIYSYANAGDINGTVTSRSASGFNLYFAQTAASSVKAIFFWEVGTGI